MPVITVLGMPAHVNQKNLGLLVKEIQRVVASVEGLGLKPEQVSVFFPVDRLLAGLGEELVAFVSGLFISEQRTTNVRMMLAVEIGETIQQFARKHVPICRLIEVFTDQYYQRVNPFYSYEFKDGPPPETPAEAFENEGETEPSIILTDSDQEMGIVESSDELILEDSTSDTVINIGEIMGGARSGSQQEIIFDTTEVYTVTPLDDNPKCPQCGDNMVVHDKTVYRCHSCGETLPLTHQGEGRRKG